MFRRNIKLMFQTVMPSNDILLFKYTFKTFVSGAVIGYPIGWFTNFVVVAVPVSQWESDYHDLLAEHKKLLHEKDQFK